MSSPFFGAVLKAIACTPNRNEDSAAYERGVIQPAREIRDLQESLGDAEPDDAQRERVLELLKQILSTKRVDRDEQRDRLKEILDRADLHDRFGHHLDV